MDEPRPTHRTAAELEAGLGEILRSPASAGDVRMIVRRPARDERETVAVGQLDPEEGLVGDSFRARELAKRPAARPEIQLTLMNARAIALIAGDEARWPLAGDQLYVDLDLSWENLPPGTRLAVGDALVEITAEPHTGCKKFVQRFGMDAMTFVNSEVGLRHNLRGIHAMVVRPGAVRVGDRIAKVAADDEKEGARVLTVHHLDNSRSQRVLWLLEELGVPYEIAFYKRDPETMLAPRELRAVHPLGKAPVVTIDDGGERVVLAESGAILEELVDRYGEGRLRPAPGTQAARDYRYWMHYAEGSAMSPLLLKLIFGELPKRAPWLVKPLVGAIAKKAQSAFIDPQLKTHMGWWEASLEGRDFLAGEFTAADIQMSFPVEAGLARAAKAGTYPRVEAYLARLHARPAWKKALERGGPYAILGG